MSLASCAAPPADVVLAAPEIPADLLRPVLVPERPVDTLADIGLVLTDHVEALDTANGRICAVADILTNPCPEN